MEEHFVVRLPDSRFWQVAPGLPQEQEALTGQQDQDPHDENDTEQDAKSGAAEEDTVLLPADPTRPPRGREPWWQLIWCSHHCFNAASEGFRLGFASAVRARGGLLQCVKKIARLAPLLMGGHPRRAMLLEWPETKRWLQAYQACGCHRGPLLLVVRFGKESALETARQWFAQHFASLAFQVQLRVELGPFDQFAAELAQRLALAPASLAPPPPPGLPALMGLPGSSQDVPSVLGPNGLSPAIGQGPEEAREKPLCGKLLSVAPLRGAPGLTMAAAMPPPAAMAAATAAAAAAAAAPWGQKPPQLFTAQCRRGALEEDMAWGAPWLPL